MPYMAQTFYFSLFPTQTTMDFTHQAGIGKKNKQTAAVHEFLVERIRQRVGRVRRPPRRFAAVVSRRGREEEFLKGSARPDRRYRRSASSEEVLLEKNDLLKKTANVLRTVT